MNETPKQNRRGYLPGANQSQRFLSPCIKVYEIAPMGKPRMTRRDQFTNPPKGWRGEWPRRCVAKWRAFKDLVNLRRVHLPRQGAFVIFAIPMPESWSMKKKYAHLGAPHESKPDLSNCIKALEDACYQDDSKIWQYRGLEKRWSFVGEIIIVEDF